MPNEHAYQFIPDAAHEGQESVIDEPTPDDFTDGPLDEDRPTGRKALWIKRGVLLSIAITAVCFGGWSAFLGIFFFLATYGYLTRNHR